MSDITSLPTPPHCVADFCLIPIGTSSPSVSAQVADVQRLIEKSGLKYVMHSAGTTLEGSWDRVHQVIGQAHMLLHQQGVVRIQSDIRVGSRTDKEQSFEDKVNKVRELLAKD
ncbi:putative cell wall biogenesis protein Ecm15 [Aspergillus heteromorphus CBS 117.55]|uniref:Putative cell wall biogenesis protein Ecm15 n=1 Tax=Aspergillus heteromorphus CBS 117.55 TaxID=1448321 RepID=A0A317WR51_9EURO|nr:putative cell wall biogenesis protein Ecm15 [Aspergillus heteromorphus CBS 117.55]PWY87752.1 putative cell wall biogenesis protein Ecm15 [Aspergillus heteromorphus CBS 117.55]